MSIGFAGAGLGASTAVAAGWSPEAAWTRVEETWDRVEERVVEAVWGWVDRIVRFSFWALERVLQFYPVEWMGWITAADERVCPECGPRHGERWEETEAHEAPPLHTNCRCHVAHVFTEWRSRWVEEWRLRWGQRVAWSFEQTGWRQRVEVDWRRTTTTTTSDGRSWSTTTWF